MTQPIERDAIYRRRRFPREVIEGCVRWYLTYRLSYRDLVALMAEWGVHVSHTTIMRWVHRYVPEYEKRWNRRAKPVGSSWRMDETYIRTRPKTGYLYRAVDKQGRTVASLFHTQRGIAAAMAFFRKAVVTCAPRFPRKITLDGGNIRSRHLCGRRVHYRGEGAGNIPEEDQARVAASDMALSEIEIARVKRALDSFMQTRRPPPHIRPKLDLSYRISGQSVEIFEIRPAWRGLPQERHESAVAKATFVRSRNVWRVFWQRRDLKWHGYEPANEVRSIDDFLSVVAEDRHACFFG